MSAPRTILCLASFFKGGEFIREAARLGARVVLLTRAKLSDRDWPRECLAGFCTFDERPSPRVYRDLALRATAGLAVDAVVALEEYDVVSAAVVREALGVPGMGAGAARLFHDKLAMREWARSIGLLAPEFIHVASPEAVAGFLQHVPGPWMLKPRIGASAMGMRYVETADAAWSALAEIQSRDDAEYPVEHYLVEQYVAGDVYHVDALTAGGALVFESVERYGRPPFDVVSGGGIATSHTVRRGSDDERQLLALNRRVLEAGEFASGVTHVEFIKRRDDGRFYFLEAAARVGGAYTAETVEAATGVNLWTEWARIETATPQRPYAAPRTAFGYGGVAVSLAREEFPDTSAYDDAEIVFRVRLANHVGLVVASASYDRVVALVDEYSHRFAVDFMATAPLEETPGRYL